MTPTAAQLESIEAAAQISLYRAQGLRVETFENITALLMPDAPSADLNRVIGLGVSQPASEALLDRVIPLYTAPVPYFLQVIPDAQPSELHQWILARGFTPRRRWVKLWREAAPVAASAAVEVAPATHSQRLEFAQTMLRGFNMPASIEPALAAIVGLTGWRCYLAYLDGHIAGAGAVFCEGDLAYLALGTALPEFRRRGVQAALLERRIMDVQEAGSQVVVSDAAEDIPQKPNPSLHNLLRLGFQVAYKRENYQR